MSKFKDSSTFMTSSIFVVPEIHSRRRNEFGCGCYYICDHLARTFTRLWEIHLSVGVSSSSSFPYSSSSISTLSSGIFMLSSFISPFNTLGLIGGTDARTLP